ncbi:hypothetical protein ENBRE01_2484 [Enteropsectra breve]|nr:hypothetical protein ENBRE01_2484 [Enteropsectra breve]
MGNVVSRKKTAKEQLFIYEEKILGIESYIMGIKRRGFASYFGAISIIIVSLSICIKLVWDEWPFLFSACFIALVVIAWIFRQSYTNWRLVSAEEQLKRLKEEQKSLIEELKKDKSFTKAKDLMDKYENLESRESFFSLIQKKKRAPVDRISDFILGNDPEKMNALICVHCGMHNGLLDPKNSPIKFYYCYSCNQRNSRATDENKI